MPQEQSYSQGTFQPISGLPERVEKPIEAFKEVGDVLQQRYWQAKQQYNVLDNTIKNTPMFDKEVDQQHVDKLNKVIADTINPIIENDDFHKAQGTVMDLTKKVLEDKGLKSINNNVALWQQQKAEFEKRFDKEPNLRQASARMEAYAKIKYREQGGSLDINGNPQQVPIWTPTTNLDISEDKKRIQDLAAKLTANQNVSISNGAMNGDTSNTFADDPDMQRAMSIMTNDKTTVKSLTAQRIQELAKQTVEEDPQYQTKIREIAQVDLFNTQRKLSADKESIYSLISSDKNIASTQLALSMSPMYKAEMNTAIHNLNIIANQGNPDNTKIAKKHFDEFVKRLNSNQIMIKEGTDKLTSYNSEQINQVYINMKAEQLHNSVIHSADQFAYAQIDKSRDIIPTHLYDAYVRKLDKDGSLPILSTMDNGTESLANSVILLDPLSIADKTFKDIETQYNVARAHGNVPQSLDLAYKGALANRNAVTSALGDNYDAASSDIKNAIDFDWKKTFGLTGNIRLRFTSGDIVTTAHEAVNNPTTKQSLTNVMRDKKVPSKIKVENMTNYILEAIPKSQLLHGNTRDLIMKYGIQTTMSTNDFNQVIANIDKAK